MKKSFKGMTLVECIVALAIFGIMAMLLVMAASTVLSARKSADDRTKKTNLQAPVAENFDIGGVKEVLVADGSKTLKVNGKDVPINFYQVYDKDGEPTGFKYFTPNG